MPASATLGVVIESGSRLPEPQPGVDLVLLRGSLLEPPRQSGARKLAERLHAAFPGAELIPYVWHLVTHAESDGLRGQGTRALDGPAHAFGGLQDTPEVTRAWEAVLASAEGFGARRVVVQTGASLSPGAVGRQRLRAFIGRARRDGLECIWEPSGLWTAEGAAGLASELGIPMLWPAGASGRASEQPAANAWILVERRSRGARLAPDTLDELVDRARQGETLVFRGERAMQSLRQVRAEL